jgi:hypothetical protein
MKFKSITLSAILLLSLSCTDQELLRTAEGLMGSGAAGQTLTNDEVIAGLKEALSIGTENAASLASVNDGFNLNPKIHIPFPEDALRVRNTAIDVGLGNQVDRFVESLNRAAEEASREAAPIFLDAIRYMSISDGFTILKGKENAATEYLKEKTYDKLYESFRPKVELAVSNTRVGENWTPLVNAYNTVNLFARGQPVDPDLNNYVTTRAIDGLFTLLAAEELKIRADPAARITDLLKKVFGS